MFDIRAKIFLIRLQLLTLILFSATAQAQTSKEVKDMFAQAESNYLYGDFELANPLYLQIVSFIPDNQNINYKIGNCYLNIISEKAKAIQFLEKAVKNCSYDAKADQLKEKRAPLDAYFSLGKAYMINNELEKAINTFQLFKKLVGEVKDKSAMTNMDYIDQQILACKNAQQLQLSPVKLDTVKLPSFFSQGSINDFPVISYDGNTLAYTECRGVSNAIYFSKKERGKWQPPVEITYMINAGEDCSTSSLNNDGTELFLYKEDGEDGNIYSTKYSNDTWTPVKKLNANINTKFFESHASISSDGKTLYFTSNRDNEGSNLDIYVSEKDGTGDWGVAKKLSETINTAFNEETPFISKDGSTLFFSSEGHSTMGGYDVFKSVKNGDTWGKPQNLGSPINTTDDDKFFEPFNNGLNAYYSIFTDYKKKEIFYLGIGVPAVDQVFKIRGTLTLNDSIEKADSTFKVLLTNVQSGDTINTAVPAKDSSRYNFTVMPGSFRLIYTGGDKYLSQTIDTSLLKNNLSSVIILNVRLEKVPPPIIYEKIDRANIPTISAVDTAMLIKNLKVNDVSDKNVNDADVLYYTVQVMALHKPVDVSYFKHITDMKVLYNDNDKFYRYTTGKFATREEAMALRIELIRKGYWEDIFIKKVSK
jgi:tetratricopeptide (TPR) repeat protein